MEEKTLLPEIVPRTEMGIHQGSPFYSPLTSYIHPESPGTAIARREPKDASKLLKEMSKHSLYKSITESAGRVAHTYMSSLRELNSPSLTNSRQVQLDVERKVNRGLKRVIFGEEDRGVRVTIRLE